MRADLRLGQIRSGQMKKDPPRSESDPLKVHISEIITALVAGAILYKINQYSSSYTGCPAYHVPLGFLHFSGLKLHP